MSQLDEEKIEPKIPASLFQNVWNSLPDALYIIDPNGVFTYVSEGFAEFGYTSTNLIGRHFTSILHPEDYEKYSSKTLLEEYRNRVTGDENAPKLFDERRTGRRKTRFLTARIPAGDGSGRILHGEVFASGYYVKKSDGETVFGGTIGIIRNATERIENEIRLRKLSSALDHTPAMIVITDSRGFVEYVNPGFTAVTGYSAEEMIGKNPPSFQVSGNPAQSQMLRAVFQGEEWKGELSSKKKSGEEFWESSIITPIVDEHGRIENILIIGQDSTERKLLTPYFSQDVIKKIMEGGLSNSLSGENLKATILFLDIRRFTTISENMEPATVADLLNRIFTDIMDLVFSHGGSVNKMMGDAILATFGCPVSTAKDAENAADCALSIRDTIAFFNQVKPAYLDSDIQIGIGIATGKVFAGNIGSYRRMEYTVIGDVVNTASRLQTLTKELQCEILIDLETSLGISERFRRTKKEVSSVRGKAKEIEIFSLDGWTENEGSGDVFFS